MDNTSKTAEIAAEAASSQNRSNGLLRRVRAWGRLARRLLLQKLPAEEAQEVRQSVEADGQFTERYALMCALSAGIATLGLLQSSAAVVIGAMLVSPLMAPIASLGFGFASLDGRRIQAAARVVAIGALVGIGLGMALTWLSPIRNATPEIIARTAPTLLDLAVAILSGLAGGYATVHQRGETAIGVAIATALMPPLATVGYSLAVLRFDFAAGAALLFLTNLAAIAFSFALVARLRGVARPLARVEFRPFHIILGSIAFLVLATPLALTLMQVTQEATAANAARREIARYFDVETQQIVQLNVSWRAFSDPSLDATVVTPTFRTAAEPELQLRLAQVIRTQPALTIRQVVASDTRAQTEALINAAFQTQATPVALDPALLVPQPPIEQARIASAFPIDAAWSDQAERVIFLRPAAIEELLLGDYRREELRLDSIFKDWRIVIVPPVQERVFLPFSTGSAAPDAMTQQAIEDAIWALSRWNVRRVTLEGMAGRRTIRSKALRDLALERLDAVAAMLSETDLDIYAVVADIEVTDRLFSAYGDSRVTGVDIRIRPSVARPDSATP